jgi:hypothetical protein
MAKSFRRTVQRPERVQVSNSSQNKATLQVEHCGRAEVPSANPEAGTRRYRSPRDCMRLLEAHVCS